MAVINAISDFLLGPCVRRIADSSKTIYLTFDDGPDEKGTPFVLDTLSQHQAHATFFVIGEKAKSQKCWMRRITQNGHAIGNHSLDHNYLRYFSSVKKLRLWISDSEKLLQDMTGQPTVGFRPPAGVRTPPLAKACRELNEPVILWSARYYDSVRPWTQTAALRKMQGFSNGDIVLLHDRQRAGNFGVFQQTLDWFMEALKKDGFQLPPLNRNSCLSAMKSRPVDSQ
jgi:peptidoglycan/xylan/chitin deacetylase (PgdA/CDA1 family)